MKGGAGLGQGRKNLVGETLIKRVPKTVWDEAETFSLEKGITPGQAILELWNTRAHNDETVIPINSETIELSTIERPKEKPTPIEIIRLSKLIEKLSGECINPIIVMRTEPGMESYRIVNGELQYWAYEALDTKSVKAFIVEPNGDLESYQEQIQILRNGREVKKIAELEKLSNDQAEEKAEAQATLVNLREQKAELKTQLEAVQNEAQAKLDTLTQANNESLNEIQRLAKEYSELQAKLVTLQDKKAESKSTKRKNETLNGDYMQIPKSVLDKYQEMAKKATPGSARVDKLREFLKAVGFNWELGKGRNWKYEE